MVQTSSTDTKKQLNAASCNLEALTKIVSAYVNWWDQRVTDLNAIETLYPMAYSNDEAKRMTRSRWGKIFSNFTTYKEQVDPHSSLRPQTKLTFIFYRLVLYKTFIQLPRSKSYWRLIFCLHCHVIFCHACVLLIIHPVMNRMVKRRGYAAI